MMTFKAAETKIKKLEKQIQSARESKEKAEQAKTQRGR
jgi:hypothetical protein